MSDPLPRGFRFAGTHAGIKQSAEKKDIALIVSDVDAVAAGVYTQNRVVAAPVVLCQQRTPSSKIRSVVVNSGNANACTGTQGNQNAALMCQLAADAVGANVSTEQVLVMSTGIIGHQLPMEKITLGIQQAARQLASTEEAFLAAADGILTTDVGRKIAFREMELDGAPVRIAGMAKGAGMIGPNMATMLCCVLTDATVTAAQAQRILQYAADRSFNNISVEGHTSTNDTMLLLANGCSGKHPLSGAAEELFQDQLVELSIELAKLIPSDGEGASHLIEIRVVGARSNSDARAVSHTVASSNLVKTAITGGDPNWGRIVSAAGYADAEINVSRLSLSINGTTIYRDGEPIAFDAAAASRTIRSNHTTEIELRIGDGTHECTHWTSDLTTQYVRFNSEYTT